MLTRQWFIKDDTYVKLNNNLRTEISSLWDQLDIKARKCDLENNKTETEINDKTDDISNSEQMKFPHKKKDLSELKGCWKTPQKLIEQKTFIPLEMHYCFEKNNGSGFVTINFSNGDHCKAPLKTKRINHSLIMNYDLIICDKSKFQAGRIECHEENELAVCDLIDIDDGVDEPFNTQVRGAHFYRVE
jgi:hypothetical protein